MEVKIETAFIPLVFDLKTDPPEGVNVHVPPVEMQRTIDSYDIALAIINLAASVPVSVFANWLFEKLKNKKGTKIIINNKEVECDEEKIIRAVKEQMKIEQGTVSQDESEKE